MPPPSPLPDVPTVQLVLASASPARRSTLRAAGIEPVVVVSEVDEDLTVAEATDRYGPLEPADIALLLARAKAEDVAARVDAGVVVLGCDSVLELDGEVHGKPGDAAEAVARWRRMRGRSGVLHTGHWLIDERGSGGPDAGRDGVDDRPLREALRRGDRGLRHHGRTTHRRRSLHHRRPRRRVRHLRGGRPPQRRRPVPAAAARPARRRRNRVVRRRRRGRRSGVEVVGEVLDDEVVLGPPPHLGRADDHDESGSQ